MSLSQAERSLAQANAASQPVLSNPTIDWRKERVPLTGSATEHADELTATVPLDFWGERATQQTFAKFEAKPLDAVGARG
jgi:hypothetical protein